MGLLFDKAETVKPIIDVMKPYYRAVMGPNTHKTPPEKELGHRLLMVKNAHKSGRNAWLIDHEENFQMIGSCALELIGDKFDFSSFYSLLYDKHQLYTDKPLREWNELGIVIRIDSKFERYKEVILQSIKASTETKDSPITSDKIEAVRRMDETSLDTMCDILGYAVLGVLLNRENKTVNVQPTK